MALEFAMGRTHSRVFRFSLARKNEKHNSVHLKYFLKCFLIHHFHGNLSEKCSYRNIHGLFLSGHISHFFFISTSHKNVYAISMWFTATNRRPPSSLHCRYLQLCAPPRERDPPHGFLTTHLEWNFPWGFLRPAQPIICQLSPLSPQIAAVADLSGNIAEERRSFGVAFCRDRQASGVQDAHTFFTLRKLAWQQHRTHLENPGRSNWHF